MRKFLLLLSFLTIFTAVKAQDPVVSITTVKDNQKQSCNQYNQKTTGMLGSDAGTWSTYGFSNNNKGWAFLACGSKTLNPYTATITTDFTITANVNKVEVNLTRRNNGTNDKITSMKLLVSANSDMSEATTYTFDVSGYNSLSKNASATYSVDITDPQADKYYQVALELPKTSNNGCVQLNKLDYYGEVEAGAVTPPTITLGENDYVTLAQADGADIYYTTDRSEPTTGSTKYAAPFQITSVTTVKAIAVLNGKTSSVASKTLTPTLLNSIAEFLSLKPTANSKINTPLTAIYQCGRNLYLTDGTDFILAYNSNNNDAFASLNAVNGDVISSITGTFKNQNSLPELIPSAIGEKTKGEAVEPEVLAIEEIANDMLNKYVTIENVNIVALPTTNNYTATDETGSITIYNTFYNASYYPEAIELPDGTYGNTIPEGEGFTVTGFVSCYGTTLQITPIAITGGQVMEKVATPSFSPESNSLLSAGDLITITCETEGATIYYAFDDETPTTDSQVYSSPIVFSENVKINAIAVKDGMLDSDVATASYTLKIEGQESITFDFGTNGNAASLANKTIVSGNGQSDSDTNNLKDVTLTSSPIDVTFTSTGSAPRWWYTNTIANELRIYNGTDITFHVIADGYTISSIQFDKGTSVSSENFNKITVTATTNVEGLDGTWDNTNKKWTAPSGTPINTVVFKSTATARLNGFTVTYVPDDFAVAGIEEVAVDNSDAPVEYFNLQGIRVAADNLTPGIYIRRQGTEATKILVK
ncbi:MAG: chitobiase/beta-hexosaminidase C-terminal domain-containing protein [Bacteroides sp.]|nr:chitobiase/beta-hexosaminidase C-terminal domain-containing protein [Bacteroides sp.]